MTNDVEDYQSRIEDLKDLRSGMGDKRQVNRLKNMQRSMLLRLVRAGRLKLRREGVGRKRIGLKDFSHILYEVMGTMHAKK